MENDGMKYKKEELIQKVYDMRIKEHKTVNTCLEYLKSLGYKKTTCYEIIAATRDKIVNLYNENNKNVLEQSISKMEQMEQDMIANKNYKLALDIRKEINKIQGLYIEKINISGNIEHSIDVIKLISVKKEEDNGISD